MYKAQFTLSLTSFWRLLTRDVIERLGSRVDGLTNDEASQRLRVYGSNLPSSEKKPGLLTRLLAQFKSPLIIIMLLASSSSFFLGEYVDAGVVMAIILLSVFLGFLQERRASREINKMLADVQIRVQVMRDQVSIDIPIEEIVPGDICIFHAGDVIPADCLILESRNLYVHEAVLTGEEFPVEKKASVLESEPPLSEMTNTLFMGTHVISGSARAIVVMTGKETEFVKSLR